MALASPPFSAQAPQKPLTVEAIFAHGPLIGHPPEELTWSPDGKHLTYLDDGELMDLEPVARRGKPHVLVSRAKLASLDGESDIGDRPRPSRTLQDGQLPLGAGLGASALRLERAAVALRPA